MADATADSRDGAWKGSLSTGSRADTLGLSHSAGIANAEMSSMRATDHPADTVVAGARTLAANAINADAARIAAFLRCPVSR